MIRATKYTIQDHFKPHSNNSKILFDELSNKVKSLNKEIVLHPAKEYIGYALNGKILAAVEIKQKFLVLKLYRVQPDDLDDPKKRLKYEPFSYEYYNKHVSKISIFNAEEVNYAFSLIKQVYNKL